MGVSQSHRGLPFTFDFVYGLFLSYHMLDIYPSDVEYTAATEGDIIITRASFDREDRIS